MAADSEAKRYYFRLGIAGSVASYEYLGSIDQHTLTFEADSYSELTQKVLAVLNEFSSASKSVEEKAREEEHESQGY